MKIPAFLLTILFYQHCFSQQTIVQYLSGTDKDHTVRWDFMCTKGRNSGKWTTIPVPSNWELQGFGTFNYFRDVQNPEEQGLYRYRFNVAPKHRGKNVFIVFEGSMTDTEVKINGQNAGPLHQGGFYQFRYDITSLLQFDKPNTLEVTVSKHSSNASVNNAERKADFWLFGGIFRPVFLEMIPSSFIERVAIDAQANGDFNMQVFGKFLPGQVLEAQVYKLNGKAVGSKFTLEAGDCTLHHHFTGIRLWNPEQPNLYSVDVSVRNDKHVIHTIRQRFGFRTAELRNDDGFYLNGRKVIFKGVCRHSEWPESGRTLSRSVHLMDIHTIKGMNMNAVRMSHYPPDREFLDLCDSLGLFVLDELTGWQGAYDTVVGRKLVKELVVRDINHPSVVLWDNGNEGGWNRALDGDYALYDPQNRHVIHPWERFNGTNTKHYPDYSYVQKEVQHAKEVFFPTEFMHGLFDGGHGAALEDFWSEMMKHPHAAGGFLWSLHDEGVVRGDRHDSIDVAGNQAPDGIVGPHREREGSYYAIREIWSPVYIDRKDLSPDFDGTIALQNRYLFSNLARCRFEWKLMNLPKPGERSTKARIIKKGTMPGPSLAAGEKGLLHIPLPPHVSADALWLTAFDAKGDTVCTWSWALRAPGHTVVDSAVKGSGIATREDDRTLVVTSGDISYFFDKATGWLKKVFNGKKDISFGQGPALAGADLTLNLLTHAGDQSRYVVQPSYRGDSLQVKWIFEKGQLPRLEYSYLMRDSSDYMGITFNYPESKIRGMKWMGRGPYHVWKNRLRGQQFGVWQKNYNNTVTGESWLYPEFKGWHAELYWVQLQNREADFIVYATTKDIFLEMLQPQKPKAAANNNTSPPFPQGNIGFMHGISPIGTKFQRADLMGPQSQRNVRKDSSPLSGTLYFDFRNVSNPGQEK